MKPGVSDAMTGVLPSRRASSAMVSVTSGAVIGPAMTSISAISGTGLKKCIPTTRPGRVVADAMRITDSELVLVARIVASPAAASRRRNASRLSSSSSGMASTTRSATPSSSSVPVGLIREAASVASSLDSCSFSTFRPRKPSIRCCARSVAPSTGS